MKYKHIYAAHEARMWLGTIISGVTALSAIALAHPELKEAVTNKVKGIKNKFSKKPPIKIVVVDQEKES